MSVALSRWPIERRVGRVMFGAVAVVRRRDARVRAVDLFWLSFAALAASGAADMVSVVVRQSLVQLETPDAMRGRGRRGQLGVHRRERPAREFESGRHGGAARAVGSVLLGGFGTLVVVGLWIRMFPELARRERLTEAPARPAPEVP